MLKTADQCCLQLIQNIHAQDDTLQVWHATQSCIGCMSPGKAGQLDLLQAESVAVNDLCTIDLCPLRCKARSSKRLKNFKGQKSGCISQNVKCSFVSFDMAAGVGIV